MRAEVNDCGYGLAWIGPCKKTAEPGERCTEHAGLVCASCGEPATHQCEETMGLVCGANLCDNCEHTICENGCNSGAPLPSGYKDHCKKGTQKYQPWHLTEDW